LRSKAVSPILLVIAPRLTPGAIVVSDRRAEDGFVPEERRL
jgi:hypothetical protein